MRTYGWILLLGTLIGMSGSAGAATLPASIARDSLITAETIAPLTLGASYDQVKRGILLDGDLAMVLEARTYGAYLGYDLLPWATLFLTAGGSAIREEDTDEYWDSKFKGSLGLALSLWEYDVTHPAFLAGRASIKLDLEGATFSSEDGPAEVVWQEYSMALPFAYELVEETTYIDGIRDPFRLVLFAGPMVSILDGTADDGRTFEEDFEEDQSFGVAAGVDIYFADNVSVGGQVQVFDEVSGGGSVRFHF
jgi:opacity protein-like surface antigen